MSLSRRQFFGLFGVTIGAHLLPTWNMHATPAPPIDSVNGRTFGTTTLYDAPNGQAIDQLWGDSRVQIFGQRDVWLQLANGWVPRADVQPMLSANNHSTQNQRGTAQVIAAVSSLRAYADARAPLITRLGHGAVANVTDTLHDTRGDWLQIESDNVNGWAQAVDWQPLTIQHQSLITHITVDRHNGAVQAWRGDDRLLHTTANQPPTLQNGQLQRGAISIQHGERIAVPYAFTIGDTIGHGVWWHNQFGASANTIELPIVAAQWLYQWGDGAQVTVIG